MLEMNRLLQATIILLLIPVPVRSQSGHIRPGEIYIYRKLAADKPGYGKAVIHQDAKLAEILGTHIQRNEGMPDIPRYWIRIFSDSGHGSRERAYAAKGLFLRKYEGIRNDVIYDNPNYKVYVGGFRTKSEALKLLEQIKRDFPYAFIIYDRIALPEL
jgi:hypothetical protein